jgi:hypothetical protein
MSAGSDPAETVEQCQRQLAHAWMVRTFVKHSEEAEEFAELIELPRMVFDVCRALEHLANEPAEYLRTLRKKLRKLRAAAEQFARDVPQISTHTNFQQAVVSILAVCDALDRLARDDSAPVRVPTAIIPPSRPHPES